MLLWPCCMTAIPLCLVLPSNLLAYFVQNLLASSLCFYERFLLIHKQTLKKIIKDFSWFWAGWMLASPGMCLALLASSKFWAMSLTVTLLVVCPHSSGFCYVRVKRAAFLHISTENPEYFSSASPLAHSCFFGQPDYLLPWCRLVFFTGFFIELFKDLGEECAFFIEPGNFHEVVTTLAMYFWVEVNGGGANVTYFPFF